MWRFAWRNILTRPTRTFLALIGLSIPILGVVGLFSLSNGLRMLVGNTLNQIQGVIVLRNNAPSPVFSDIPADLPDKIRSIPGVKIVSPEIWGISPPIENTSLIARTLNNLGDQQKRMQSFLDTPVVTGQDTITHAKITTSVYRKALLPATDNGGRYLNGARKTLCFRRSLPTSSKTLTIRPKSLATRSRSATSSSTSSVSITPIPCFWME